MRFRDKPRRYARRACLRPQAWRRFAPAAALVGLGCSDPLRQPLPFDEPVPDTIGVATVVTGLDLPLALAAPPGDGWLLIAEQTGRVRVVEGGAVLTEPFLDLSRLVSSGFERGLLGIALHPEYTTNGHFFVNYTDLAGNTAVVRYRRSSDPRKADSASALPILSVPQPYANHNGGAIAFGPDGFLYIALGDGGRGGDPDGNGQDSTTLLGSVLRIDVDGGAPYAIPLDNPFRGHATARPEIWAYGLRNPWRISIDAVASLVYIGDVGQGEREEVNVVSITGGPYNFGWNITEGFLCFGRSTCNTAGLTPPVLDYGRAGGECSVIGGHVYRGTAISGLSGIYFYSDYCTGWLRSFRMDGSGVVDARQWDVGDIGRVLSFGEDADGELYILAEDGTVYRIVPAE